MGSLLFLAINILVTVQAGQATIVGTVSDAQTAGPIAGAVVALTDLNQAVAADSGGRYILQQVPAGPHHITVRMLGYGERSLHALVPRDGELEINVALRLEPVRLNPLEVPAMAIVRGVERGDTTAFPDRESSMAALRNHPLSSEPDAFQALGGGEVVLDPESPSGVHIRGGASDQTAYLIDGIPVFSPFHAAGVSSAWNPDALSRLLVSSSAPSSEPNTLSGAIEAVTRTPGLRLGAQGSASTTQARVTVDGPLPAGAGYLVSLRSGLHDVISARREDTYLQSETGDVLAKLEAPAWGGRIRLLGYGNENETSAVASAEPVDGMSHGPRRNAFDWSSRSLGAEWSRVVSSTAVRVLGWAAAGDAGSAWTAAAGPITLGSTRRDEGLLAAIEHGSKQASTLAEIRVEQSRTRYQVESDTAGGPSFRLSARTPLATLRAQHRRALLPRFELDLGSSLTATGGDLHLSPQTQMRWEASRRLMLSGSYARTHQFAQSLRNEESVVGNVFPVDAYVGSGAPGIPVARSDQGVIAADYRPAAGARLGVRLYARSSEGLVLIAPSEGGPFATGGFVVGSGASRGVSADLAVSSARLGLVASYGWQRVRYAYGAGSYVPVHGATHLLEGGVIVFPTATSSIRLGAAAALGRRTTPITGGFEWESCNLLDGGCEFAGSPYLSGPDSLGGTALPAYVRIDLSVRKHWHFEVGGRDASIALFGAVTNLLGRKNLLTYGRDPSTGEQVGIEMRPRAPLVAGLDWRF